MSQWIYAGIIVALIVMQGWSFWRIRLLEFQRALVTHAVLYLVDNGALTEEQYHEALKVAEPRCEELRKLGHFDLD